MFSISGFNKAAFSLYLIDRLAACIKIQKFFHLLHHFGPVAELLPTVFLQTLQGHLLMLSVMSVSIQLMLLFRMFTFTPLAFCLIFYPTVFCCRLSQVRTVLLSRSGHPRKVTLVLLAAVLLLVILYLSGACYDGANDVDVQSGGPMARSSMSSMAMLPPTATGNSYYSGARPNFSQPPSVSLVISSTENFYVSHIIFIQLYIFVFCAFYIFSFYAV